MDRRKEGRKEEMKKGRANGQTDGRKEGRKEGIKEIRTGERTDGRREGRKDEKIEGWKD